MIQTKRSLPDWIVPVIWGTVVLALTTLPGSVSFIAALKGVVIIYGHPSMNDALGHASLYGSLTAVTFWTQKRRFGFDRAFMLALGSALLLGFCTEMLQRWSPGRDVQASDLLANWLGAMTAAALIGFIHSGTHEWLEQKL